MHSFIGRSSIEKRGQPLQLIFCWMLIPVQFWEQNGAIHSSAILIEPTLLVGEKGKDGKAQPLVVPEKKEAWFDEAMLELGAGENVVEIRVQ